MSQNNVTNITILLSQAGAAHHTYEQTVLKGVYDQEWPAWYADYVIEHGLGTLLNKEMTVEQLSRFLSESYEAYQQEHSRQDWAAYTAEKMVMSF